MAKQNETKETAVKRPVKFGKSQILKMNKYKDRQDLLNVLLVNGKAYSHEDVQGLMDTFMKGKVE